MLLPLALGASLLARSAERQVSLEVGELAYSALHPALDIFARKASINTREPSTIVPIANDPDLFAWCSCVKDWPAAVALKRRIHKS